MEQCWEEDGKVLMLPRSLSPLLRFARCQINGGGLGFFELDSCRSPSILLSDRQLPASFFGSRAKSGSKKVDLSYLIPEEDLVESIISGWGKGGQAVNKTKNAVHLKHVPTGRVDPFIAFILTTLTLIETL